MVEIFTVMARLVTELVNLIKNTTQNPAEGLKRLLRVSPLLIVVAGIAAANTGRVAVTASPKDVQALHEAHAAQEMVEQSKNAFFRYLFDDYRSRILDDFGEMKKGSVVIHPNPVQRIALRMLEHHVQKELIATSSAKWWDDDFGRKYEQANIELVRKRVHVTRIFLYANEAEKADLLKHLKDQKQAGIDVWLAPITGSMPSEDYIVVDDAYAGVLLLAHDRSAANVRFEFDSRRVQEIANSINEIQRGAQRFSN